jgi:hypothetical protein
MKNVLTLGFFTHTLLGFALSPVFAQTPTPPPTATLAPAPEPTPTPPLRDNLTQVLPDRHVTFRLFAPRADAVAFVIGVKSGPNEPQGRGYTRDAAIRPNKPDRLRAEFSLFTLLLALRSIK